MRIHETDRKTYARRRKILSRIDRAEVSRRIRTLRSRGIKVVTLWHGSYWLVMSRPESKKREHVSSISLMTDGIHVAENPSPT